MYTFSFIISTIMMNCILKFKYGKDREMLTLLFLTILRLNYVFYFRLLYNFNMFTVAKETESQREELQPCKQSRNC